MTDPVQVLAETVRQQSFDCGYALGLTHADERVVELEEQIEDAYDRGWREGNDAGFDEGLLVGRQEAEDDYENGHEDGFREGYDEGLQDGREEA